MILVDSVDIRLEQLPDVALAAGVEIINPQQIASRARSGDRKTIGQGSPRLSARPPASLIWKDAVKPRNHEQAQERL
jgi:hypothetical protein